MITPATPAPAATVVLLRDGDAGLEVYLVRRSHKSAFMGGVYVFPGGKVDPADRERLRHTPDLLERALEAYPRDLDHGLEPEEAAAYVVAAARETQEEAGLTLDVGALAYLSHWVTPPIEPRRFSARFFLGVAPRGQDAQIDAHEVIDGAWQTPGAAIARYVAGEIDLAPPTLYTLTGLLSCRDAAAGLACSASATAAAHAPELVLEGGTPRLVLAGDPLHPTNAGTVRRRFVLEGRRWRLEFDSP